MGGVDLTDGTISDFRTMSLSTLTPVDDHRLKRRELNPRSELSSTGTRLGLAKSFDEIPGIHPARLIPERTNRPDFTHNVEDITGRKSMRKSSSRQTNPVEPVYILPSYKDEPPYYETPFLRDTLQIDDIEGTRTVVKSPKVRDLNMAVRDIEGAYKGWAPRHRANFGSNVRDLNLDVADINARKPALVRPRTPIEEHIPGSRPHPWTRQRASGEVDLAMRNDDIEGAHPLSPTATLLARRAAFRDANGEPASPSSPPSADNASRPRMPLEQLRSVRQENVSAIRHKLDAVAAAAAPDELMRSFKRLDRDRSNKLTRAEFRRTMEALGVPMSEGEINTAVAGFDADQSGYINYKEFARAVYPRAAAMATSSRRHAPAAVGVPPMASSSDSHKPARSLDNDRHGYGGEDLGPPPAGGPSGTMHYEFKGGRAGRTAPEGEYSSPGYRPIRAATSLAHRGPPGGVSNMGADGEGPESWRATRDAGAGRGPIPATFGAGSGPLTTGTTNFYRPTRDVGDTSHWDMNTMRSKQERLTARATHSAGVQAHVRQQAAAASAKPNYSAMRQRAEDIALVRSLQ
eukprot:jgi/Mesvir1/20500/Mv12386-RA.1